MNPNFVPQPTVKIALDVPLLVSESLKGKRYGFAVLCWMEDDGDAVPVYVVTTADIPSRKLQECLYHAASLPRAGSAFRQTFGVHVRSCVVDDGEGGAL